MIKFLGSDGACDVNDYGDDFTRMLSTAQKVPYSRLLQILQDYVGNDADASELGYVRDILSDVCGVTAEEAEAIGLGYLFDV